MWQRFTERARRVVLLGQEEAGQMRASHVGTEHLLLGLMREGEGTGAQVLAAMGVDFGALRAQVEPVPEANVAEPKLAPEAKRALELAHEESRRMSHKAIGTEHLLLALLRESDGRAAKYLSAAGVDFRAVRERVLSVHPATWPEPKLRETRPTNDQVAALLLRTLLHDHNFARRTLAECGLDVEAAQKRLRDFLKESE